MLLLLKPKGGIASTPSLALTVASEGSLALATTTENTLTLTVADEA